MDPFRTGWSGSSDWPRPYIHTYIHTYILIHTYTLFNLKFTVAKDKLVSSSYKYDFKTTKTRNYDILIFKLLKRYEKECRP